jgi:hypothetical protein
VKLTSVSPVKPKSMDRTTRYKSAIRLADKAQNLKLKTQNYPPKADWQAVLCFCKGGLHSTGLVHSIIPLDNAYNSR